jgi:hypothetical protein
MTSGARPDVGSTVVAGPDYDSEIKHLQATMHTIAQVLDLDAMRAEIAELGEQVAAPDLWDDQDNATRVTGRLSVLQGELDRFAALETRVEDLGLMVEMATEEGDADSLAESEKELAKIKKAVEALEVRTLLSGEYDSREALVTIRAGAGGVDAADFAEMLMRMYTRWAERNKYPVEVFDTSYAEEAGISRPPSPSTLPTPTARSRSRPAPTGWSGSARSTTRAGGRPGLPRSRWFRSSSRPTRSRSLTRTSGSTSTVRPAPVGSRSTRPTRPSASPTSRPARS